MGNTMSEKPKVLVADKMEQEVLQNATWLFAALLYYECSKEGVNG